MNTQNSQELSDAQLDTISGGCYRPEPPKCEPKPSCYEPKKYSCHDEYDYEYEYEKKGCWKGWKKFYQDHHDWV